MENFDRDTERLCLKRKLNMLMEMQVENLSRQHEILKQLESLELERVEQLELEKSGLKRLK